MSLLQSTEATRAWLTYREYERVRVLGRGQHGSAVLLRHGVTGECVVSKEVLIDGMDVEVSRCHASPGIASQAAPRRATPSAPTLAQELDKVTTEVLILSTLKHANITGFYGSFQREETLSIVMEYADGGNLADTIVRQAASGEHFATERVLGWLAQLCSALQVHSYCFPRPTAHCLLTSHCVPTCLRAYVPTAARARAPRAASRPEDAERLPHRNGRHQAWRLRHLTRALDPHQPGGDHVRHALLPLARACQGRALPSA